MVTRLQRFLAGEDGPGQRALPAGELLHPVPLAALVVLVANDHWLKSAGLLPGAVTGKLSDFAGLLLVPLLLTASLDVLLLAAARWFGAPVDFSLRRWKLVAACLGTAGLFAAIKLSPVASEAVASALTNLGFRARIVLDPTDLGALPMVALAYYVGMREIRRVPLGRLESIERAWRRGRRDTLGSFDDVISAGADPASTRALAASFVEYLESGDAAAATRDLRSIRAPRAARTSPRS